MNVKELNEKRGAKLKEASTLSTDNAEHREKIKALHAEIEAIDEQILLEARNLELAKRSAPLSHGEGRDIARFDLGRALRASAGISGVRLDGIEAEMVQQGANEARSAGVSSFTGIMLPRMLVNREQRDVTATGQTSVAGDQGGMTVASTPQGLLDAFYNADVLTQLGVTSLRNLSGNITLPRIVRGTAPAFKAENANSDEYSPTFATLTLTPNRLPTFIDISEQLLVQSTQNIEAFLRNTLVAELMTRKQVAILHGSGANNEPVGLALSSTNGITQVHAGGAASAGTNADGAAPVWADFVNMKKAVAVLNANQGATNYLFNEALVGKLEQTVRVSSTDSMFILDDRAGRSILGKTPAVTNAVSSALSKGGSGTTLSAAFYGNWNDLVVAEWGGLNLELIRDGTLGIAGMYRLMGAIYFNSGVVRPASFSYVKDFITA